MLLARTSPLAASLVAFSLATATTQAETAHDTASCQPSRGSLTYIGCNLAAQLGVAAQNASVVVLDLKSDRELPSAAALRERLGNVVASALRVPTSASGAERSKLRVELSIEKSGGVLRVSAELRRATSIWQRLRHAAPKAEQHAFVEVPLDAELRALIPPPPLVVSEVLKIKAPERGIVALACGPLTREGAQELALVTRGSIRLGHIAGHAFVERKRAAWSSLSGVAAAPLREPIASASVSRAGTLRVGLTDRRDALELSGELEVLHRFEGKLPADDESCVAASGLGLSSRAQACTAQGPDQARSSTLTLDALAGTERGFVGRELGTGRLVGSPATSRSGSVRLGAQLALGDADSDGAPELAYSVDTLDPAQDKLTLVTLEGDKLRARFELPIPGIGAIAICRREGPGMAPIVVASGDELWLLR